MEYWFLTTGAKHNRDLFVSQMQAQPFVLNAQAANGQKFQQTIFGMLEPVELWRYVFPKEGQGVVLSTLAKGRVTPPGMGPALWAMRKGLGLKEIPPANEIPEVKMAVKTDDMWIVPLGIKEDRNILLDNGVTQEGL